MLSGSESALLTPLVNAGLTVRVAGNRLAVVPAERITSDLRRYIIEHKEELLAQLAANDPHHDGPQCFAFPIRLIGQAGTGYLIDHDGPASAVADLLARYGDRLDLPALAEALRGMDDDARAEADKLISRMKGKPQ